MKNKAINPYQSPLSETPDNRSYTQRHPYIAKAIVCVGLTLSALAIHSCNSVLDYDDLKHQQKSEQLTDKLKDKELFR